MNQAINQALSQTESVAFWLGLIASIVGIVLSVVAIVFAILVDRRSNTISNHIIQSLQKIESAVERSSSDSRELIKAGWDKMLGNVGRAPASVSGETSAKEIGAGIVAELRSELVALRGGKDVPSTALQVNQFEKFLKNLQASVTAQLKSQPNLRPSARLETVIDMMSDLSPTADALLRAISNVHLTKREYNKLSDGCFGSSVLELRKAGLLVPLVHKTAEGPEPCYYFPPGMRDTALAAFHVLPPPPQKLQREVAEVLESIGYPSGHDSSKDFRGEVV